MTYPKCQNWIPVEIPDVKRGDIIHRFVGDAACAHYVITGPLAGGGWQLLGRGQHTETSTHFEESVIEWRTDDGKHFHQAYEQQA